jgi:plastocyanin
VKSFAILLALAALEATTQGGTITGTVHAQGKDGADPEGGSGKYDSRRYKFAERIDYAQMRDFVVYVVGGPGTNAPAPGKPVQVITTRKIHQQGAIFSPHVLPVLVGTTVEWPNNDEIFHNVFSISEPKEFDLGLYKSPELKRITFDKPGRVDVFCSIHKAMSCVVLVLETPFFASTDVRGRFAIPGVPAGTYQLKAWHERLPTKTREVTVPAEGEIKLDFILGVTDLPKY